MYNPPSYYDKRGLEHNLLSKAVLLITFTDTYANHAAQRAENPPIVLRGSVAPYSQIRSHEDDMKVSEEGTISKEHLSVWLVNQNVAKADGTVLPLSQAIDITQDQIQIGGVYHTIDRVDDFNTTVRLIVQEVYEA